MHTIKYCTLVCIHWPHILKESCIIAYMNMNTLITRQQHIHTYCHWRALCFILFHWQVLIRVRFCSQLSFYVSGSTEGSGSISEVFFSFFHFKGHSALNFFVPQMCLGFTGWISKSFVLYIHIQTMQPPPRKVSRPVYLIDLMFCFVVMSVYVCLLSYLIGFFWLNK